MVQDNREPLPAPSLKQLNRACLQPCPTNCRSEEAAHSTDTKCSPLQMLWVRKTFLKAQSYDPTAWDREALTSYQLQGASSHPASLQGHNSNDSHIIHSATCTASLSPVWLPSPKSGTPRGCSDFLFSYHNISGPFRKPFCSSPKQGTLP